MTDDDDVSVDDKPTDRLTRLCAAMTEALAAHPEYIDGDRAVVFINDDQRGGIVLHGYDDDMTDAVADLFVHLRAMFRAQGAELQLIAVPNDASGLS